MFERSCVQIPAPYTGWTFFTFFVAKIKCLFEGTKINEKEVGDGPFKKYTINMISNTFAMQVCK